jgi:hypothetical protein
MRDKLALVVMSCALAGAVLEMVLVLLLAGLVARRRREVRKVKTLILSRAGWSSRDIAEALNIGQATVIEDVNGNISDHLTEDLLREASEGLTGELDYSCRRLRRAYVYAATKNTVNFREW